MNDIQTDEIYEHAVEDFQSYTGTEQDLPGLRVVEGSVLEGEPEYFSETEVYFGGESEPTEEEIDELVWEYSDNPETLRIDELEEEGRKVIQHYGEVRDDVPVVDLNLIGLPHGYEDMVDRENYQVVLGEDDLDNFTELETHNLMLAGLKLHADSALEEAFEPVKQRIFDQYEHLDPEMDIHDFYWSGLSDSGGYGFGNRKFSMGLDYIDEVDIQEGETNADRIESMLYHEGIHAMQSNTNPMFNEYLDGLKRRSDMTGDVEEVMGHPRAFLEAATTFETAREFGEFDGERERNAGVREAWEKGPEALKEYAEQNSERLHESEYVFGQFISSVVNHHFQQNTEQPLENTREWLINGVTPVNGMAGTAINAFENMGIEAPDTLKQFRSFDERVPEEERKDPDQNNLPF